MSGTALTVFTVAEVAEQLRVSPDTVRRWIKSGELVAFKFGDANSTIRIPSDAIDELLGRTAGVAIYEASRDGLLVKH